MKTLPVTFIWHEISLLDEYGEVRKRWVMDPLPRYDNLARRQYSENGEYALIPNEFRNKKFHGYYFASINEGFLNLPENIAERFDSAKHLRKYLLVRTGFFDEREIEYTGKGASIEASRTAAWLRGGDEYIFIQTTKISAHHVKLIVRRAKSQAEDAMGKDEFEASCKAVLDELAALIGVKTSDLTKNAGKSA